MSLTTVLTMRMGSERLPGKGMIDICGKPLAYWIITRLSQLPGNLVLATTSQKENLPLIDLGKQMDVPVWVETGAPDDVVGRMDRAWRAFYPESKFLMRGMGDMPFPAVELMSRSFHILQRQQGELFLWYLFPESLPCYGSREFPLSVSAFSKINRFARGEEREHVDMWMNRHREQFKVVFHEPPPSWYFRDFRFEVDYPRDIDMIRHVARDVGMLAPVRDIVGYLNEHEDIANINRFLEEKTGPTVSYPYRLRREWVKLMQNQEVIAWDGHVWGAMQTASTKEVDKLLNSDGPTLRPPEANATPLFCQSGQCLVGWGGRDRRGGAGIVYTIEGHKLNGSGAWLTCKCGAGRFIRSGHI